MGFYTNNKDKKSGDGLAITEWNDLSNAVAGNSGLTLAINAADKVGIGTTSPGQKLEVAGGNAILNNVFVGDVGHGKNWACFSHSAVATDKKCYALMQNHTGQYTVINKKSGDGFMSFRVDNEDKMVMLDNGNLGIGTKSPSMKLEVSGDVKATKFIGDGSQLTNLSVGATGLNLATKSDSKVGIGTTEPQAKLDVHGDLAISNNLYSNGSIFIKDGRSLIFERYDRKMFWSIIPFLSYPNHHSLMFKFRNPIPSSNWEVAGSLTPRGGWISPSDQRIKKDIEPLSNVLEEVMKLQPRSYRWFDSQDNSRKFLGFIAQEVEQVFPDCVSKNDDLKGLNYNDFAVMAIAAIKEVKLEYDKRIAALEQELADLKKKVDTGV
ncbi:tail fiber domain-containing protein [Okeania sp. SIO1I7]|uniref:tail fiber domain-containing protein n=1 Tax=Okeania sp. SIO1I7 TaxID=2607772 RepID=UPI0013FB4059|nr:tail fiber domain-containing protein [Okeania sp. SIO1I7]NET27731.1 tail fiber domain-containing protein [Okeania sp. SIO1I7]